MPGPRGESGTNQWGVTGGAGQDARGDVLGLRLTDTVVDPPMALHVIVRLIRPGSTDLNPVHKDICSTG